MWMVKTLPDHVPQALIYWNPFYHFIQLVRAPLFGEAPSWLSWFAVIGIAIVGWTIAIAFFGKYRSRVAYWL